HAAVEVARHRLTIVGGEADLARRAGRAVRSAAVDVALRAVLDAVAAGGGAAVAVAVAEPGEAVLVDLARLAGAAGAADRAAAVDVGLVAVALVVVAVGRGRARLLARAGQEAGEDHDGAKGASEARHLANSSTHAPI